MIHLRIVFLYFSVLAGGRILSAQNLVVNPSFEDIQKCPSELPQLELARGWKPVAGTPDLMSECGFYEMEYASPIKPFHGKTICRSIWAATYHRQSDSLFREFMQGTFSKPLLDSTYFVSMRILAFPTTRTRNLSVYFSPVDLPTVPLYAQWFNPPVPQFTLNDEWLGGYGTWTQHGGCVDSVAGAKYFVIGNFGPLASDVYEKQITFPGNTLYFDQIEVRPLRAALQKKEIYKGNCMELPATIDSIPYIYVYKGDTIQTFCGVDTGTYEIWQYPKHCHKRFRLEVTVRETNCNVYVPNVLGVGNDNENSVFKPVLAPNTTANILDFKVWDRWGSLVFDRESAQQDHWDGYAGGRAVPSGVYVYSISYSCLSDGKEEVLTKTGDVLVLGK